MIVTRAFLVENNLRPVWFDRDRRTVRVELFVECDEDLGQCSPLVHDQGVDPADVLTAHVQDVTPDQPV